MPRPQLLVRETVTLRSAIETAMGDHAVITLKMKDGATVAGEVTLVATSFLELRERPDGHSQQIRFEDIEGFLHPAAPDSPVNWGAVFTVIGGAAVIFFWAAAHCFWAC